MAPSRCITRRQFTAILSAAPLAAPFFSQRALSQEVLPARRCSSLAVDGDRARFYLEGLSQPVKLFVISDTHLFRDDQRGEPFRQYSERMAGAYHKTTDIHTGNPTDPETALAATLEKAKQYAPDALVLLGDMVSFPSEAGVEWLVGKLNETELPWYYISGNHDWHYEGLPGSEIELRGQWAPKRLGPLYRGENPLMYAVDIKGIRLVMIDDSTNEILPEQLEFFRAEAALGQPMILGMHIPLYAEGRGLGFGCGHPDWDARHDHVWEIERRERWPETGHSATTLAFRREVLAAPNMLGVVTGHIHQKSLDVIGGTPQFVVPMNAAGGYLQVEILPSGNPGE